MVVLLLLVHAVVPVMTLLLGDTRTVGPALPSSTLLRAGITGVLVSSILYSGLLTPSTRGLILTTPTELTEPTLCEMLDTEFLDKRVSKNLMASSTSHKANHIELAREFKAKSIASKVLVDYHKSSGNKFEATIFPAMDLIIEHDPETRITSYEIINRHGPGSEDDVVVDAGSTVGPYFGKAWSKSLCAILETHLEKYLEFAGDTAESLSRSSTPSFDE